MKRILIILLFVFSLTSFGYDLTSLIKDDYDLAFGVVLPPHQAINDFTNVKFAEVYVPFRMLEEYLFDENLSDTWYKLDFSEDPFNGVIEIYAVGQPSASVNATFVISLAAILLLLYKKKRFITI